MSSPRVMPFVAAGLRNPLADINVAEMLELSELTEHQYFGERALLDGMVNKSLSPSKRKVPHSASVVARAATECLLLSKYDFYHFIGQRTQDMMMAYADKFYFDEERIRRSIQKQHRWENFKKDLLKDVLSPRAAKIRGKKSQR